jgi:hypothetical protein
MSIPWGRVGDSHLADHHQTRRLSAGWEDKMGHIGKKWDVK